MRNVKLIFFLFIIQIIFGFKNSNLTRSYNLFHIGRSRDKNIIKYDINLNENGKINTEKPLKIYWVRYTDDNKIEGLSFIQSKLAYGVEYLSKTSDEVRFQFVSYDKRTFIIQKGDDGKFHVFTELKNEIGEMKKIFIQIDGGTFMIPQISYVELFWKSSNKPKLNVEIIKP